LVHKFSSYVYCFSLHVSGNYVLIIGRKYRNYATPGICHSIQMTVWYAGRNEIQPCIPHNFTPTSRPDSTHTGWQTPMPHRYSNFLPMLGTWMPETCREEK